MKTYLVEYLTRIGQYKSCTVVGDILGNAYQNFMDNYPDDCQEVIGVKKI